MILKKPDEEKLAQMYGQNEDKKKAYRKGWYNAGRIIQQNREKSKQSK